MYFSSNIYMKPRCKYSTIDEVYINDNNNDDDDDDINNYKK